MGRNISHNAAGTNKIHVIYALQTDQSNTNLRNPYPANKKMTMKIMKKNKDPARLNDSDAVSTTCFAGPDEEKAHKMTSMSSI